MIRKFLGYTIATVGFLGWAFFRAYKGSVIQNTTAWYILFFLLFVIGLAIVYLPNSRKSSKQKKLAEERLLALKQKAEKIFLTLENCEVRENNYYEEVEADNSSRIVQIDAAFDPNRNYSQNYVEQSAIIYYYSSAGKKVRMTSQSFPFSAEILRRYIDNNKVCLWVSRFKKEDYEFEILS